MATWRNGSAFGFDRRRHQKVAGSSPAVVIFLMDALDDVAVIELKTRLWLEVVTVTVFDVGEMVFVVISWLAKVHARHSNALALSPASLFNQNTVTLLVIIHRT